MKRLLTILSIILLTTPCYAGGVLLVGGGSSAPAGPSYLIAQNFEGTGYDNSETWTESCASCTCDEDDTSAPLVGSQSFKGVEPGDSGTRYTMSPNFTYTAGGTLYGFVMWKQVTAMSNYTQNIISLVDSGGTVIYRVEATAAGNLAAHHGTQASSSVSSIFTFGTVYYIWWDYAPGTGANGVQHVYVSTNTTKPSATLTQTNGQSQADAQNIRLNLSYSPVGTGGYSLWDHVYVSTTDITGVP